jgi:hypothetical protein
VLLKNLALFTPSSFVPPLLSVLLLPSVQGRTLCCEGGIVAVAKVDISKVWGLLN